MPWPSRAWHRKIRRAMLPCGKGRKSFMRNISVFGIAVLAAGVAFSAELPICEEFEEDEQGVTKCNHCHSCPWERLVQYAHGKPLE